MVYVDDPAQLRLERGLQPRPPRRRVRAVTDEELGSTIQLGAWTENRLLHATKTLLDYGARFDLDVGSNAGTIAQQLILATPHCYMLGDGGLVFFAPLMPGSHAVGHIFLWQLRYYRRPDLLRAIARDAFRRWNLRRITGFTPARHKAALRNAERIGFKREGLARRALRYNGGVDDTVIFGLLPEEVGL